MRNPAEFRRDYEWARDFPIDLQDRQKSGRTLLDFEFELNANELTAFRGQFGSALNGLLPKRVALDREGDPEFTVRKQRVGGALSRDSADIARFVGERIRVEYIPSIRTAQAAMEVVDGMVEGELGRLEDDPGYQNAVRQIQALQEPLLRDLSETVRNMLSQLLPDVSAVEIQIPSDERYLALRRGDPCPRPPTPRSRGCGERVRAVRSSRRSPPG
jgi:hypothetical protein